MQRPPATHYGYVDSPVGRWLVLVDGPAVTGVYLADAERTPPPPELAVQGGPVITQACEELAQYFAGTRHRFDVEVVLHGTQFQRDVWRELAKVPYGATCTYSQLAARVGRPDAVRAVGAANGANPVSVIVPCHRVIGADSSLTGYGWGVERKRWLLDRERPTTQGTLDL